MKKEIKNKKFSNKRWQSLQKRWYAYRNNFINRNWKNIISSKYRKIGSIWNLRRNRRILICYIHRRSFFKETIQSLSPTFQFSQEKDNTPYVFVPNSNGALVLLAKLNRGDMVVENINQLKMLLAELTEKHQKRLIRVSRIKEVNNERKHYIKNNKYK